MSSEDLCGGVLAQSCHNRSVRSPLPGDRDGTRGHGHGLSEGARRSAIRAGFSEPVLDKAGKPKKDEKGRAIVRGTVRSKVFRLTYCAARLQTLDRGAPVSVFTVGRELGHGGDALVKRIYGHLGDVRHRSEVVEYRVEQHEERLRERLTLIGASGVAPAL